MNEADNPYRPPANTETPASKSTGKAKRLWLQMLIGAVPVPLATLFVMLFRDQSFIDSLVEGTVLTVLILGCLGLAHTIIQHFSQRPPDRNGKQE